MLIPLRKAYNRTHTKFARLANDKQKGNGQRMRACTGKIKRSQMSQAGLCKCNVSPDPYLAIQGACAAASSCRPAEKRQEAAQTCRVPPKSNGDFSGPIGAQ